MGAFFKNFIENMGLDAENVTFKPLPVYLVHTVTSENFCIFYNLINLQM